MFLFFFLPASEVVFSLYSSQIQANVYILLYVSFGGTEMMKP